jgi:hypothetical protein
MGFVPQPNLPLLAVPEATFSTSDSPLPSRIVTSFNSSIWHDGLVGISPQVITVSNSPFDNTFKIGSNQGSLNNSTFFEISSSEIGAVQRGQVKISPFQIGSFENSTIQNRTIEFALSQNSTFQIYIPEVDLHQVSSTQIDPSQISTNQLLIDGFNFNPTEISLPSSITLQQFLSSHNFSLQNTTVPSWLEFLQGTSPFNLNIEIADLPTGQLAEATITGFDPTGRPNSGTLYLDVDANGLGWYIDPTPWDNTEYSQTLTDTAYRATPDSIAYGHYDLLTTLLHETAHLQGFIAGYSNYDRHIQSINGSKTPGLSEVDAFVGDGFSAILTPDGSHLNSQVYPYDLMNTTLTPGVCKLPSALDIAILNTLRQPTSLTAHHRTHVNLAISILKS